MKFLALFCVFAVISSCYVSDVLPEDQPFWSYGQPRDFGFDESLLLKLDSQIVSKDFDEINSLIIIKDDHIIFENYYDGSFRNRLRPLDVATFGYTVAFMDLFIQRGLIGNLDDPIYLYLPEYDTLFQDDPTKRLITFRHLLDQVSGLSWNQFSFYSYSPSGDFSRMKANSSDWTAYILNRSLSPAPGLQLAINSGVGIILCKIYQNLLGEEDLLEFFTEHYFAPLQITDFTWARDPSGTLDGATGLSMNNLDHAKLAMILSGRGRTPAKQRILSEEWVGEMAKTQREYSVRYDFGYGLRILKEESVAFYELAGYVNLRGDIGQQFYIAPNEELIIAIGAENYGEDYFYNNSLFLFLRVLDAKDEIGLN